jgi:hypothetical protein
MNSHCRLPARLALECVAANCTSRPAAMKRPPRLKSDVLATLLEGGSASE